jgi:hypothetical protein
MAKKTVEPVPSPTTMPSSTISTAERPAARFPGSTRLFMEKIISAGPYEQYGPNSVAF